MESHLLVEPTHIHGFPFIAKRGNLYISASPFKGNLSIPASPFDGNRRLSYNRHQRKHRNRWVPLASSSSSFTPATEINGEQNHYTVLGVARNASSADIKRAYRLLALKNHPDVNKDSRASEVFKSIHHAYEVLSNEATRIQYDRALEVQEYFENPQFVKSALTAVGLLPTFIILIVLHTFGPRFFLTLSCLMALFDNKLNAGFKIGYGIAWVLGGRHGVLLSVCLWYANMLSQSSTSAVVLNLLVVAIWVSPNLASFAPLPQGALLSLLYMSTKLQVDLLFSSVEKK